MKAINNLIGSGCDFAALSANTPHIVFDKLQERSDIPLVSIVETAKDEAVLQNLHRLGLLGIIFTMTGDFFKTPFYRHNIEIMTPKTEEMECVNRKRWKVFRKFWNV